MTFICCQEHLLDALAYEGKQIKSYNAKSAIINVAEIKQSLCQVCHEDAKYMVSITTYNT